MANKYIADIAGQKTEVEATVTSAGAADAGEIIALDAAGLISTTMMPVGIGADTASIPASENLLGGDFVNVWNDGGTVKIRKAIAEDGKLADGFVLSAVTSPAAGLVYFEGKNTALSGLTLAGVYFLSDSAAGTITTTAPTAATKHVQRIGKAFSVTTVTTEGLAYGSVKKA